MKMLQLLFFLLSTIISSTTLHAAKEDSLCPVSSCGDLSLSYPFKLANTQPQNNCTYINLSCNKTTNTPVVNLPYAGDFYVRTYEADDTTSTIHPYIQLYDPGNCLMKRLMNNLNLSSSPFEAITYYEYTYYTCPNDAGGIIGGYILPIDCLSNASNKTVAATSRVSQDYMLGYNCSVIGSWLLPVIEPYQFEIDVEDNLYLTWRSTTYCEACEDDYGDSKGGHKENGSWRSTTFSGSRYLFLFVVSFAILLFEHLFWETLY